MEFNFLMFEGVNFDIRSFLRNIIFVSYEWKVFQPVPIY